MSTTIQFGFEIEPKHKTQPLIEQTHGTNVVEFDSHSKLICDADGIITTKVDTEIYIFTADCIPFLIYSGSHGPIAAIHAGWRGCQSGIVPTTLKLFPKDEPINIIVGPHIRPCCFEIKNDFIESFESKNLPTKPYTLKKEKRLYFDLLNFVIHHQLANQANLNFNIQHAACTFCNPSWPSFRRNKSTDPRIRSWINKVSAPT